MHTTNNNARRRLTSVTFSRCFRQSADALRDAHDRVRLANGLAIRQNHIFFCIRRQKGALDAHLRITTSMPRQCERRATTSNGSHHGFNLFLSLSLSLSPSLSPYLSLARARARLVKSHLKKRALNAGDSPRHVSVLRRTITRPQQTVYGKGSTNGGPDVNEYGAQPFAHSDCAMRPPRPRIEEPISARGVLGGCRRHHADGKTHAHNRTHTRANARTDTIPKANTNALDPLPNWNRSEKKTNLRTFCRS